MKFPLLFMLILSGLALHLSAQMSFSHLESDVAMRSPKAIHRCSDGYLWIGNGNGGAGLLRYDGHTFKQYQHNPEREDSLSGNLIYDILEDSKKQLWVASDDGVDRYDPKYDSFTRYQYDENAPHGIGSGRVVRLLESSSRQLWALTAESLNRYDPGSDRFDCFTPSSQKIGSARFTGIVIDLQGRFWILEDGPRIWRFYPDLGTFEAIEIFPSSHKKSNKSFYRDHSDDLWIADYGASNPGLIQFFPETKTLQPFDLRTEDSGEGRNLVKDILEYPEGQLLLATRAGLSSFDKKTQTFGHHNLDEKDGGNLSSNNLFGLYEDEAGILWVGNAVSGIDFYNPLFGQFDSYQEGSIVEGQTLPKAAVVSLFEDRDGLVFAGIGVGGMSIVNPNTNEIRNLKHDPMDPYSLPKGIIRGIGQSSDGRIWLLAWGGGIHAMREVDGRYRSDLSVSEKLTPYESSQIWDIEIDREDRIWLSIKTPKRKIHVLDKNLELIGEFSFDSLESGGWHSVFSLSPLGEIIVTAADGIYRYDETSNSLDRFIDSVGVVTTVAFESQSETYYVGTRNKGLLCFDRSGKPIGGSVARDEFSSLWVQSIEALSREEIWFSTDSRLYRFLPLQDRATRYGKNAGLAWDGYIQNNSIKARDGRLYFGGFYGLIGFDPQNLSQDESPLFVAIDRISLFGRPLDHRNPEALIDRPAQSLEELNLNWKQNQLNFSFTGVNPVNPGDNRYAYKLEGVDPDWLFSDASQRNASYANLSPGSYVFRVKASKSPGVWSEAGNGLRIEITPPFWQRLWFYLLVSILVGVSGYGYILNRERSLRNERTRLAEMVKKKTKELETHREQLEVTVENRTKELVTARDAAEEAQVHAEESDRLKSQFLANLSHEIRTPLNAIIGFSSLMKDVELEKEERGRYSDIIEENSVSLLTLIDDILDFSLIEANQMKIEPSSFSLNEFIDNLHSSYALRESKKRVEHRLDNPLHDENLWLMADRSRVKQLIDNLMTNACKFTNNGFVELGVYRNSDTISFYVEDTGPGIPESELELIFETFVKRQVDDRAAFRGVGLGLAICKRLAQLMEGELSVESVVGKGSTFTLSLPLRLAEPPKPSDETLLSAAEKTGKRVLVIEDEPANYQYIENCLQKMGIDSVLAESGEKGISTLRSDPTFDLILLDIKMPGMDGFETLKRIRSMDSNISVIAQTAYAMKSDENRIRRAGFDGYLPKPINRETLISTVETKLA